MINYLQSVAPLGIITTFQRLSSALAAVTRIQTQNGATWGAGGVRSLSESTGLSATGRQRLEQRTASFQDILHQETYLQGTRERYHRPYRPPRSPSTAQKVPLPNGRRALLDVMV